MAGRVRQAWSFFGGWCHWGEKRSSGDDSEEEMAVIGLVGEGEDVDINWLTSVF